MTQPKSNTHHYQPAPSMTPGQTLLWFLGGIAAMFLIVSIVFAIKLATEGRLSLFGKGSAESVVRPASASAPPVRRNPANEAVTPPVLAAAVTPGANGGFVSGSENLLPPEAAHLAKAPPAPPVPATAPAPTAPAPAAQAAPVPPKAPASASTAAIEAIPTTLNAWAAAWGHKDIDAYLKHYAADFQPGKGLDRQAWAAQRKQRLARPEEISVSIADLEIKPAGDKASARFTQTYRAGANTLRETKTLELALHDGRWLIQQEHVGG